jgi:hypothetical protein
MAARWKPPTRWVMFPLRGGGPVLADGPLHRPAEALEYGYVADVCFLRPAVSNDKPMPGILARISSLRLTFARAAVSPRWNSPAHLRRPAAWPAEAVPERPGGFDQLAGHPDHLLIYVIPFVSILGRRRSATTGDACPVRINCRLPRCRRSSRRPRRTGQCPADLRRRTSRTAFCAPWPMNSTPTTTRTTSSARFTASSPRSEFLVQSSRPQRAAHQAARRRPGGPGRQSGAPNGRAACAASDTPPRGKVKTHDHAPTRPRSWTAPVARASSSVEEAIERFAQTLPDHRRLHPLVTAGPLNLSHDGTAQTQRVGCRR